MIGLKTLAFNTTTALIFLGTIGLSLDKSISRYRTRIQELNSLYNQLSFIADTDKRNGTTHDEWQRVYTGLRPELHYDVHLSDPRKDLSEQQMRQYLSRHQQASSQ